VQGEVRSFLGIIVEKGFVTIVLETANPFKDGGAKPRVYDLLRSGYDSQVAKNTSWI
jgi:hypothetical protein